MFVFTAALPLGFLLTSLRLIKDIFGNATDSGTGRWGMNHTPINELEDQEPSTEV